MNEFKIPGAPLTGETPFCDMDIWAWAQGQDRADVSVLRYLEGRGFVPGEDKISEDESECLRYAVGHFHRTAPWMSGEAKFKELFTRVYKRGYFVSGRTGYWEPCAGIKEALDKAGWLWDEGTYFKEVNGVLWAHYNQIIGSRPLVKVKPDENLVFKRVASDVNGNARYVVSYLACLPPQARNKGEYGSRYAEVVKLMNSIGGRKYNTKKFGGGIVFQSASVDALMGHINRAAGLDYDTVGVK